MGQEIQWKLQAQRGIWGARQIGGSRKWKSLKTRDKEQAKLNLQKELGQKLLPEENAKHLTMAKAHLDLVDPELSKRTWGELMNDWANEKHLGASTIERRTKELERGVFPLLKDRLLCDTTIEALIVEWKPRMGVFAKNTMRHLQNHAKNLGWILNPIVKPIHMKVHKKEHRDTRAITLEEHEAILEREKMAVDGVWPVTHSKHAQERYDYYTLLFLTGAAQTDGAKLKASNIDWKLKELVFHRQKTKERCAIQIGGALEKLLKSLPKKGQLFPSIALQANNHRASEFYRRLKQCGIKGISLHSYRYWMAELFAKAGRPIREAQIALGHSSKAVATAYAKHAKVAVRMPEAPAAPAPDVIDGVALVA